MLVFEFQITLECGAKHVCMLTIYSVHDSEYVTCLNRWLYVLDIFIYNTLHKQTKTTYMAYSELRCRHKKTALVYFGFF